VHQLVLRKVRTEFQALQSRSITVLDMAKETIKTRGCNLLLDVFQFVGTSRRNVIPNIRSVFQLRSNYSVQYTVYRRSREEKVVITLRTRPMTLIMIGLFLLLPLGA
jgi:hypothetical protein